MSIRSRTFVTIVMLLCSSAPSSPDGISGGIGQGLGGGIGQNFDGGLSGTLRGGKGTVVVGCSGTIDLSTGCIQPMLGGL